MAMDWDGYGAGVIYIIHNRSTLLSERDREVLNGIGSNKTEKGTHCSNATELLKFRPPKLSEDMVKNVSIIITLWPLSQLF